MLWSDPCNCLDPFRPVVRCHTVQTEALQLTELDGDDRRVEPAPLWTFNRVYPPGVPF